MIMSLRNNNDVGKINRVPFTDKTNVISNKSNKTKDLGFRLNDGQCKNSATELQRVILNDPKFKLITKVHVQQSDATTAHKPVILNDSKFKLITTVHVRPLDETDDRKQTILNDPKLNLNTKVHLQRLHITNRISDKSTKVMGHDTSSQNNLKNPVYDVSKVNSKTHTIKVNNSKLVPNLCSYTNQNDNCLNQINNRRVKSSKNATQKCLETKTKDSRINLDCKFFQKLVVQVNRCKELEEALKLNATPQQKIVKTVHFAKDLNITTKFDKALRKRRTRNYAELSFRDSIAQDENAEICYQEHVPVYLQNINTVQNQQQNDPFEFVSYSPRKKRLRGRPKKEMQSPLGMGTKRRGRGRPKVVTALESESDGDAYDKSFHIITKECRQKIRQKNKYVKRNNAQQKNIEQPVTATREIRQKLNKGNGDLVANIKVGSRKLLKQIESKQSNVNPVQTLSKNINEVQASSFKDSRVRCGVTLFPPKTQVVSKNTLHAVDGHNGSKRSECDRYFGFDDDSEEDDPDISRVLPVKQGIDVQKTARVKSIAENAFSGFTALTSTPLANARLFNSTMRKTSEVTNSDKIHIISDVLVSPSRANGTSNQTSQVVTASASLNIKTPQEIVENEVHRKSNDCNITLRAVRNRISKRISTPWRGDHLNVKRNPHFLTLKDTSLPCYNQEMIMEPKLMEKLNASKIHAQNEDTETNMIQTSILDFVNSGIVSLQSTPVKKGHNKTLFDESDFSPIKSMNVNENSSLDKVVEENDAKIGSHNMQGRRNIFRTSRNSSPLKPINEQNNRNRNEELGLENYFGFDDNYESDKENVRITRDRNKYENKNGEQARPMRVHLRQVKKIQNEVIEEMLVEINKNDKLVLQEAADDGLSVTEPQGDVPLVGLFEDLEEVKPPQRVYERKGVRRARALSVFSDVGDEEEEEKPKRKRKNLRARAEQQEFNDWAAQFNAMCDEVEKHRLETD